MQFEQTVQQIKTLVDEAIVPGVSYAIIENQQVFTNVIGDAELLPQKIPLEADQLYDLASLTKVIGTTTLILRLLEKGRLSLWTKVHSILPTFKDRRVTILHLLTHTSDLRGYIANRNQLSAAELKKALLTQLTVGPDLGTKIVYTDIGMLYLGWIIETIYQKPVQDLIQELVLTPLKMQASTFYPQKELAVPTELTTDRGLIKGTVHDPKTMILKNHSGAAGLFAPLKDVVRFAQFQLGQLKLEHPPVSQASIKSLYHDWTPRHLGRSLGWDLRFNGQNQHALIYHTGFTGTCILLDRQRQTGMVILSNRIHPTADNHIFLDRRDAIVAQFIAENQPQSKLH
ncbi:serine hydrolase domain-containing protein [Latilactobacillus graminis]|uniref:Beta-lactamase family protein n=2 Tax=Latilactobacillus graminis TaxID=60519 RepID=A0AA89I2B5_9LACO|nr:serine hydrolase domain-containing protein [Latilactobacillus graminis]KRM22383.1 beta-lactamase family protein [Latilactobacillus graminis DSM 20719]QFP79443.1 beta-lactamase family protein [Latilactobacillus graminis]